MSQEESALKFNQVLLVELTAEGIAVPEGKVWKVVSAVSDIEFNNSNGTSASISYFVLNNEFHADLMMAGSAYHQTSFSNCSLFPMWLPPGSILSSGLYVSALSIIEFNTD